LKQIKQLDAQNEEMEKKLKVAAKVTRQLAETRDRLQRENDEARRHRAIDADLLALRMGQLHVKADKLEKQRLFEADEYVS
jgi:hypothetical protein